VEEVAQIVAEYLRMEDTKVSRMYTEVEGPSML
jgi:hypothetical protein